MVGSNETISQAIKLGSNFSTVILVGNPKEDVRLDKNIYWRVFRKQMIIKGK